MANTNAPTLADYVSTVANNVPEPVTNALHAFRGAGLALGSYLGGRGGVPDAPVAPVAPVALVAPTAQTRAIPMNSFANFAPNSYAVPGGTLDSNFNRTFQSADPHVKAGTYMLDPDHPHAEVVTKVSGVDHPAAAVTLGRPSTIRKAISPEDDFVEKTRGMTPYQLNLLAGLVPVVPAKEVAARNLNNALEERKIQRANVAKGMMVAPDSPTEKLNDKYIADLQRAAGNSLAPYMGNVGGE